MKNTILKIKGSFRKSYKEEITEGEVELSILQFKSNLACLSKASSIGNSVGCKTMLETDFPNTASKKDCKALFPSGLLSVNSFLKIESLQGSNKAVGLGR